VKAFSDSQKDVSRIGSVTDADSVVTGKETALFI
jgi:hypothetical protein